MSNSESCPDIFDNIDKYLEPDIKLDALEITYEDILKCYNYNDDNIIMYIFRSISIDNDDLAIDLLNKIISIIKRTQQLRIIQNITKCLKKYLIKLILITITGYKYYVLG